MRMPARSKADDEVAARVDVIERRGPCHRPAALAAPGATLRRRDARRHPRSRTAARAARAAIRFRSSRRRARSAISMAEELRIVGSATCAPHRWRCRGLGAARSRCAQRRPPSADSCRDRSAAIARQVLRVRLQRTTGARLPSRATRAHAVLRLPVRVNQTRPWEAQRVCHSEVDVVTRFGVSLSKPALHRGRVDLLQVTTNLSSREQECDRQLPLSDGGHWRRRLRRRATVERRSREARDADLQAATVAYRHGTKRSIHWMRIRSL